MRYSLVTLVVVSIIITESPDTVVANGANFLQFPWSSVFNCVFVCKENVLCISRTARKPASFFP
jgi:hypothetical protein